MSCPGVVESIEALSPADLPDDHDWAMHPPKCLLAVQRGTHQEQEAVDIEVVVDSGSDASCLPMSWASIGRHGGADSQWYRDAQGHRISGRETRTATIEIGGVKFREQWLLSSVTQPLFCIGKTSRSDSSLLLLCKKVAVPQPSTKLLEATFALTVCRVLGQTFACANFD